MSSTQTASAGSGSVKSAPRQLTEDSLPPRRPTFAATFLHDFGTDAGEDMSNFHCGYCAQIDPEGMLRKVWISPECVKCLLQPSKELWKSSQAGCWGCRFFWHIIENDTPILLFLPELGRRLERNCTKLSDSMIKILKQQDLSIRLTLRVCDFTLWYSANLAVNLPAQFFHGTEFSDVQDHPSGPESLEICFLLEPCTTKFDPFDSSSPKMSGFKSSYLRHPIAPNANAPECHGLIRSWLRLCSTGHKRYCGELTDKKLPARIIVVPQDVHLPIRLKRTRAGERGRYVTLSHCWGSGIDFVATTANVAALQKNIPFRDLCTNFQDAVTITRNLGFQYLWIDALCILQDSRQEWAEQSALMAQIYQRSALMISAAAATQPQHGFLRDRPLSVARSPNFGKLNGMVVQTSEPFENRRVIGSIDTRAWCYQERIMAPRIVRFDKSKVRWECNSRDHCEDQGNNAIEAFKDSIYKRMLSRFLLSPLHTPADRFSISHSAGYSVESPDKSANQRIGAWYRALTEYNDRSLTVPTDKFPAISGLAAALRTKEMGQYLAGIWEKSFFEGLGWCRTDMAFDGYDEEYIAPTWSWASIKGDIWHPVLGDPEIAARSFVIWNTKFGPRLVDRDIRLVTQNPYGQIAHGSSVTIEGFCSEITIYFFQRQQKQHLRIHELPARAYFEWPTAKFRGWYFSPERERAILQNKPFDPSAATRRVTCLQIDYTLGPKTWLEEPTLVLLLIEPVDDDHACFRRVGILYFQYVNLTPGSPIWNDILAKERWERRTIKLI
ncbi:Heterokaryon incompatibility protein [Rutstroemia sp. NJR-2017a BVV2]|nr:Heterokaryon incompatibility protein [Rutstroemia sp. NJR-2017a BVV2]